MKRLLPICLATLVLAQWPEAVAQQLRSIPIRRFGAISDFIGAANLVARDLNGDGTPEIISCSDGAPIAVTYSGGQFSTMWIGQAVGCTAVTVGDRNGSGANQVIVVTGSATYGVPGRLLIFDPRSLGAPIASVTLPGTVGGTDVAIGNVDSDPGLEIIAVTSAATYVYDAATLSLKWTATGFGGTKVALGDVDGDGRMEIIVNGPTGSVLDAQNKVLKWGYVGGFGRSMAVGDVDGDGKAEIVFVPSYSSTITILNGDTFATSTITTSGSIGSIAIGDANGDGSPEIIVGNTSSYSIQGLRPSDGAVLWSVANPDYDVQAILTADVDGDGKPEVMWASTGGTSALYIADPLTKTIKWKSPLLRGTFSSAVGDLDGDGHAEMAVGSSGSGYYGVTVVEVFDVSTGASKGALPMGTYGNFSVSRLAIGHVDPNGGKDIVALGTVYSNPLILVWDGVTHVLKWASAISPYGSPMILPSPLLVANLNGDPVDSIIVGQSDSKVLLLRGASDVIGTSLIIDGSVSDMALADLNNDGVPDLIVGTTTTLYVFDTSTWAKLGQTPVSYIRRVAATPLGGGIVAVSTDEIGGAHIRTFVGAALTPAWNCSSLGYPSITALAFAAPGGLNQLLAGNSAGQLRTFPLVSDACPAFSSASLGNAQIYNLTVAEATGDSRPDLLIDAANSTELDLIGWSTELRGDVDGDGLIGPADIDALVNYVFGGAGGLSPAGDVNADQRIGVEDAFQLINYQYAGGAAPPP